MSNLNATIVVDLGFGDSGKGATVDWLCRQQPLSVVVRFHGGSQAAHNVVSSAGQHHTFSQFGSGSLLPGVRTHLSHYMLLDLGSLANEAKHLWQLTGRNPYDQLTVDERALVVTPFQKAANRIREWLRGDGRHGSCGMGIGETTRDAHQWPDQALHAGHLRSAQRLSDALAFFQALKRQEFAEHLPALSQHPLLGIEAKLLTDETAVPWLVQTYQQLASQVTIVSAGYLRLLAAEYPLVFEGAQGVLLDENFGFHPYTTWSTATSANALALLEEIGYRGRIIRLGVLRTYHTRHGAGPFPTEDSQLTATMPDLHNGTGQWQGSFRIGWFDAVLARYALAATGGVDGLVLTHLDRIPTVSMSSKICTHYQWGAESLPSLMLPTSRTDQERLTGLLHSVTPQYQTVAADPRLYQEEILRTLGVPLVLSSSGPTADDKHYYPL